MASYILPSSVMAIKFNKCDHTEAKSLMICVRNAKLIEEIFNEVHIVQTDLAVLRRKLLLKDSNMKGFPGIDFKTSTEYFTNYLPKLEV